MSLRLKLLLLGLATLVLPWAGCQYVREMEAVLREGEREALQAVATTIAASLQDRNDLLYRETVDPDAARTGGPFDLRPWPLDVEPFLDGQGDEWPQRTPAVEIAGGAAEKLVIRCGVRERMLFVLLDVTDDRVVFDDPSVGALEPTGFGDRVWLAFDDLDGMEHQYFISAVSAGAVRAKRIEIRELGREVAVEEARIAGAWRMRPD